MSRSCRMIHGCCCFEFNWRTGITTISFITETIQLAISYLCILLLKCLKTHIDSTILKKGKVQQQQQIVSPSLSTINELKAFYFIIIIYALVIFIFGIIYSILLISGAKTCQPNAILAWLIYQAFFVASSFVITYILIKVRDDEEYVYKSMEHKTFYDLSTGIYWVTFISFLPVLLYFWKRVLFFYIEMIKGTIHTAYNIEYNNNFISDMGHGNSNNSNDDDDDEEGQSVAFIAESFVKNVTLDIEQ